MNNKYKKTCTLIAMALKKSALKTRINFRSNAPAVHAASGEQGAAAAMREPDDKMRRKRHIASIKHANFCKRGCKLRCDVVSADFAEPERRSMHQNRPQIRETIGQIIKRRD